MKKTLALIPAIMFICTAFYGCSSRMWYEGLQENQRRDCYRLPSQTEIQQCLERVDAATYDRYQRERKGDDEPCPAVDDPRPEPEGEPEIQWRMMGDGYRRTN